MVLVKNMLLQDAQTKTVYRLLDELASIDSGGNEATHVVLIDVNDASAMPIFLGKLRTLERLAERALNVVEERRDTVNLNNLTRAENALVNRRWALWKAVEGYGASLYDKDCRGKLASELAEKKVASKPFFYRTLRLYWQRGGGKASFITDFPNCGRPGERRIAVDDAPKPGRPRTVQPGIGIAATETHRANMRLAWSRSPVGKDGRGLRGAWTWMLIARYPEHVAIEPGKVSTVKVTNYNAVPTFEQFRYHWQTEHPFELRQLNRLQRRRFDLAFKPLLTGTLNEVRGPGTRYYIDATILDVYCVSRLNRNRIVGRPTLYVVVDQFSRMIVGMYVGLEPPCWAGAMLALWNCSLDKVLFCSQYGIDITPELWPTGHMPVHLMGDRGELSSDQADLLSTGFNLDVENARPYAGEAKGVGERVFGTIQAKFGPYLPGYVDKEFAGRDAEPAALRAAMNIHDVTRAMILAVLHSNLRVVRDYDGWPEVISAGVPFVPVSLWHWGVENLRCDARHFDDAHLRRHLWPECRMKLSRKALHFQRGLYYMGVDLGRQHWFAKSLIQRDSLQALYHPMDVGSAIVLPAEERTGLFEVELTRRSKRFAQVSLSEVMSLSRQSRAQNAGASWENLPQQALLEKQLHETVKHARQRAAEQLDPTVSKSQKLKNIRSHRDEEIALMTGEVLLATTGSDPTGRLIEAEATVVSTEENETVDAVRKLIQKRRSNDGQSR